MRIEQTDLERTFSLPFIVFKLVVLVLPGFGTGEFVILRH